MAAWQENVVVVPWGYTVSLPLFCRLVVVKTRELGCCPRATSESSWETKTAGRGEKILLGRDLELRDLIPWIGRKEFRAFAMSVVCVGVFLLVFCCS